MPGDLGVWCTRRRRQRPTGATGRSHRLQLPAILFFRAPRDRGAMPHSRARTFWRAVFANGRMGLLQNVSEGCWPASNAESMVRVRAGDAGGDWESNLNHKLLHNAPLGNHLLSSPMHQRELGRRHVLLFLLPQPALAQRRCNVRCLQIPSRQRPTAHGPFLRLP